MTTTTTLDPAADPVPCRNCQYDLRGLDADGRCPECGVAVRLSLGDDLLRSCDPEWVSTVQAGVRTLFGMAIGAVGCSALFLLIRSSQAPAATLLNVGCGLGLVAGQWLVTTPDPSGRGTAHHGASRTLARATVAVGVLRYIVAGIRCMVTLSPEVDRVLVLAWDVFAFAGIVGIFATLRYLRELSLRIPDAELASRAGILAYGLGGCFLFMQGLFLVAYEMARHTGRPWQPEWAQLLVGLVAIPMIGFGVMYLRVLNLLSTRLGEQAAAARLAWSMAEGDGV